LVANGEDEAVRSDRRLRDQDLAVVHVLLLVDKDALNSASFDVLDSHDELHVGLVDDGQCELFLCDLVEERCLTEYLELARHLQRQVDRIRCLQDGKLEQTLLARPDACAARE
jgi:hypothetical protein